MWRSVRRNRNCNTSPAELARHSGKPRKSVLDFATAETRPTASGTQDTRYEMNERRGVQISKRAQPVNLQEVTTGQIFGHNRPMNALQPWQLLLITLAGWINRHQQDVISYIQEENRILKGKLKGKRIRFTDDERHRLAVKGKALGRKVLDQFASVVTPDTILAWHRKLIAQKWDYSNKRGPGRLRTAEKIRELTVQMAQENPRWGYTTIMGMLANLGHVVARETVRNILKEHGIEPAPDRSKRIPWSTFLKSHWGCLAATDLFTVEVWSRFGLTRYYVLFFIRMSDRSVHLAGITRQPHAGWIKQIARNITDPVDGFLLGVRYLIMDRDAIFTAEFRSFLKQEGVNAVRLPPRSPNLNAYAERFVRTIKESCLSHMIFFGEGSLRRAIREFLQHYHHERNHQGLGNRLIDPGEEVNVSEGEITCRARLGGLLRYYYRQAA